MWIGSGIFQGSAGIFQNFWISDSFFRYFLIVLFISPFQFVHLIFYFFKFSLPGIDEPNPELLPRKPGGVAEFDPLCFGGVRIVSVSLQPIHQQVRHFFWEHLFRLLQADFQCFRVYVLFRNFVITAINIALVVLFILSLNLNFHTRCCQVQFFVVFINLVQISRLQAPLSGLAS